MYTNDKDTLPDAYQLHVRVYVHVRTIRRYHSYNWRKQRYNDRTVIKGAGKNFSREGPQGKASTYFTNSRAIFGHILSQNETISWASWGNCGGGPPLPMAAFVYDGDGGFVSLLIAQCTTL